jgi:hypothetical protein
MSELTEEKPKCCVCNKPLTTEELALKLWPRCAMCRETQAREEYEAVNGRMREEKKRVQ